LSLYSIRITVFIQPLRQLQVPAQSGFRASDRSTGSRAPAPTAARPSTRPERHRTHPLIPPGSGAPAPSAAPPGARPQRRLHNVPLVPRQPCSRAHCSTSRRPPISAQVDASRSQWCSRTHRNVSRCPPKAAMHKLNGPTGSRSPAPTAARSRASPPSGPAHVISSYEQTCSHAHARLRCPPRAAAEHTHSFHGQSCARAHFNNLQAPGLSGVMNTATRSTGSRAP